MSVMVTPKVSVQLVRRYKNVKRRIDELNERAETLRKAILEQMGEAEEARAGEFVVKKGKALRPNASISRRLYEYCNKYLGTAKVRYCQLVWHVDVGKLANDLSTFELPEDDRVEMEMLIDECRYEVLRVNKA